MTSLHNQTVLVTGANRGMGRHYVTQLLDRGVAKVYAAARGVQVVGVYVGLVDTDMASFSDSPKSDPADVVRQVLDGIEAGADEVLADELTRTVRAELNKPVSERTLG
jgi:NAD(P)-dependent dehydrogenase (short-subunit alcohol dehydrogenase family)